MSYFNMKIILRKSYIISHPGAGMKKNLNKADAKFEKMLNDEFQNKSSKSQDTSEECSKNYDKDGKSVESKADAGKKPDTKTSDDKK